MYVPLVGSSRNTIDGRAMSEQEMVNRRFSPPDNPLTLMPPGKYPPTFKHKPRPLLDKLQRNNEKTTTKNVKTIY